MLSAAAIDAVVNLAGATGLVITLLNPRNHTAGRILSGVGAFVLFIFGIGAIRDGITSGTNEALSTYGVPVLHSLLHLFWNQEELWRFLAALFREVLARVFAGWRYDHI